MAVEPNDSSHAKKFTLHQTMQKWAEVLPLNIQQRMSCELLANLAGCLVSDSTVFEIVNSLIDIQHIVEKELFYKRIKLQNAYSAQILNLTAENLDSEEYELKKKEMHCKHLAELKTFDKRVVDIMDDKVKEQQQVLESAGVPGFRQTTSGIEIKVQMCLLDFIIRSGKTRQ